MPNHLTRKICLALLLAITVIVGGLALSFLKVEAQGTSYDLAGWMWTDNYGWISLNYEDLDSNIYHSVEYKVSMDASDQLSGWAWSSNVGWICFGATCASICNGQPGCNPANYGTAIPLGGWVAKYDESNKQLSGWAKVISLKDEGWIHLGMGTNTVAQNQKGEYCYECTYNTSTPPELTGCQNCYTRTNFDGANIPELTTVSVAGGSGNICFGCTNCKKNQGLVDFRISCDKCSNCFLYGGSIEESNGGLNGWGWNGNGGASSTIGAGWVQFNQGSGLVYPWLQTLYGTVFSRNKIKQKSVVGGVNATYCIFAKKVKNFTSGNCQNSQDIDIAFPKQATGDTAYQNALGRLDLVGLETVASGSKYNKYGQEVKVTPSESWTDKKILGNAVYVINGDLTLGSGFGLQDAVPANRGNGTVIVNGNLKINNDFVYSPNQPSLIDLKQLASVAWIVKGDVIINPSVTSAVGAFIVLGKEGTDCQYEDGTACDGAIEYPTYKQNGYGVFFSGDSATALTVAGLAFAKAFDFGRTYSSLKQGSETIVYDGRLVANPPPGLESFLDSLPVIRDFQF
jgi:hypothetical protein